MYNELIIIRFGLLPSDNNISCDDIHVSPSSNPVGKIGSGYPAHGYDCNRLLLPILRQKMAQSCGIMFVDLPDGCCYDDRNTWNTFPVSEQKITLQ
jgi:hypothetical protein